MNGKKIAVGMSGGVDSSVAAALLLEQGYTVTGVFIEAYNEPGCRTDQDKKDALKVALQLGIPFQVIDLRKEYKDIVVKYFLETYREGRTPNPDIVCNREIKFGIFYEWAMAKGFNGIATGHYARISNNLIQRAVDLTKDQSYFLWSVPPEHLGKILFPLGGMTKKQVRAKARELKLPVAEKADSMGVCMMGEMSVSQFLREKLGEKPGEVVINGQAVGSHTGLWFHTIGQRGGFTVDKTRLKKLGYHPEEMEPMYVIGKEGPSNQLIVGAREQAKRKAFLIMNEQSLVEEAKLKSWLTQGKLSVRIRNLGELELMADLEVGREGVKIETAKSIFGVAEGQAAVIYARLGMVGEEVVVAGGEISV